MPGSPAPAEHALPRGSGRGCGAEKPIWRWLRPIHGFANSRSTFFALFLFFLHFGRLHVALFFLDFMFCSFGSRTCKRRGAHVQAKTLACSCFASLVVIRASEEVHTCKRRRLHVALRCSVAIYVQAKTSMHACAGHFSGLHVCVCRPRLGHSNIRPLMGPTLMGPGRPRPPGLRHNCSQHSFVDLGAAAWPSPAHAMQAFAKTLAARLASAGVHLPAMAAAGIDPNKFLADAWEHVSTGSPATMDARLQAAVQAAVMACGAPAALAAPASPAPVAAAPTASAAVALTEPAALAAPDLDAPAAAPTASAAIAAADAVVLATPPPADGLPVAPSASAEPELEDGFVPPASAVPGAVRPPLHRLGCMDGAAIDSSPCSPLTLCSDSRPRIPRRRAGRGRVAQRGHAPASAASRMAVLHGHKKWGTPRRSSQASAVDSQASACTTDSQDSVRGPRLRSQELRTAFVNAILDAASAAGVDPPVVFEILDATIKLQDNLVEQNAQHYCAPTKHQMASAIARGASDVRAKVRAAKVVALAADIVTAWRWARRATASWRDMGDDLVQRIWPGRCMRDVALAMSHDQKRCDTFMEQLAFVDTEFSLMASALGAEPVVPERLMKRPAAASAAAQAATASATQASAAEAATAAQASAALASATQASAAADARASLAAAVAAQASVSAAQASAAAAPKRPADRDSAAQASAAETAPKPPPPKAARASAAPALAAEEGPPWKQVRARMVSDMLQDKSFMPGAPQRERFAGVQKALAALAPRASAGGCSKCRYKGCNKCRE